MKVRILNNDGNHWLAVHKDGCAHLKRNRHWDEGEFAWVEDHDTLTEIADSIASDFIAEGSMTVDEARDDHIYFYPCVTLPKDAA